MSSFAGIASPRDDISIVDETFPHPLQSFAAPQRCTARPHVGVDQPGKSCTRESASRFTI
jgi:hypothetical protein